MKKQTPSLKNELAQRDGLEAKLDVLADAYRGETAFLLTCGPSFGRFDAPTLRNRLRDELVLAVKQTYETVGATADFHLLNPWNYKTCAYEVPPPIVVHERHDTHPQTPGLVADLLFPSIDVGALSHEEKLRQRLCVRKNFEDYLFAARLERPWGPGIMYELGFYLAIHLGARRIVAVGWDIGDPNSCFMPHFYKEAETQKLERQSRNLLLHNRVFTPNERGEYAVVSDRVDANSLYNIPGYYEDEVSRIADSTDALYDWLLSRGVSLEIVSNRSIASPRIPRTTL